MKVLLSMAKAVVTSPSFMTLFLIVGGVVLIRWYCVVIRKLNDKRGY